jgi:molybdate transport system substrate-binding protein
MRRIAAWIIGALLFSPSLGWAQEIRVAAASDLQFALQDLATRFEKESGKKLTLIFGSSGNFFAQIQNGAPFDIFFSANLAYPKKLEAAGLIEPGTYYEYATGKLVLWVPSRSQLDINSGLRSLTNPAVRKIAIANPQHAPYGQAAIAALKKENLYDKVSDKLVLGENISQTASFVLSGAADAGIVALSLALGPNMKDKGRFVEIPSADYPPIQQACVVLKSSRDKATARAFLEFLRSAKIRDLVRSYGFTIPGNASSAP